MRYLDICQRVARLAGVGGSQGGKPDAVSGNPHRTQLVCDFVAEAVREIESGYLDWTFLNRSVDFFVEPGAQWVDMRQTQPDILSVNEDAVYGRQAGREQQIMPSTWKNIRHIRQAARTQEPVESLPTHFAAAPDGEIALWPTARKAFVLRADVVLAPKVMAADDDLPNIPVTHIYAVIYRALAMYHEADEAEYLEAKAMARYTEWFTRLEAAYLPNHAYSRTFSPEQQLTVGAHD